MKPEEFHFLCHHENRARDGLGMQELLEKSTETGYKHGMGNTEQGKETQLNTKVNFRPLPLIGTITIFKPWGSFTLDISLVNCDFSLPFSWVLSTVVVMGIIPQHSFVIWALHQQNQDFLPSKCSSERPWLSQQSLIHLFSLYYNRSFAIVSSQSFSAIPTTHFGA